MTSEDFVNFDDFEINTDNELIKSLKQSTLSLYEQQDIKNIYDKTTLEYYRVMRENKLNVFLPDNTISDPKKSFQYCYRWNAYSGEKIDKDPYGPLYFLPDDLIYYYYLHRLDMLWIEPVDETGGYYQGYYGDAVGASSNITISSRGNFPERYLFRLPIHNCYLPKTHHMSTVTMGPILTDEEIKEIDTLAEYYGNSYYECYRKKRPNLFKIKQLYDQALSITPDISMLINKDDIKYISQDTISELYIRANRSAVDELIKM